MIKGYNIGDNDDGAHKLFVLHTHIDQHTDSQQYGMKTVYYLLSSIMNEVIRLNLEDRDI